MPKYYIHAEAFNLDPIVYDTHDISTIRGGSFMLLDAIQQIPAAFPGRGGGLLHARVDHGHPDRA